MLRYLESVVVAIQSNQEKNHERKTIRVTVVAVVASCCVTVECKSCITVKVERN